MSRDQLRLEFLTLADSVDAEVQRAKQSKGRISARMLRQPPVGAKYGKLTVRTDEVYADDHGRAYWFFRCECGKECKTEAAKVINGRILTCGCLKREATSAANTKFSDPLLKYKRCVAGSYRKHARALSLPFELSEEHVCNLMAQPCFYCGRSKVAVLRRTYGTLVYNGIDRLDSTLGYVEANCVACCKVCNIMKQSLSVSEFIQHLELIANHTQGRL